MEALAANRAKQRAEAICIAALPGIEAENLFIDVTAEVKGLDRDIGAPDRTLEQRPEILNGVGRDAAIYILERVIDDLMRVAFQAFICAPRVGVDRRTLLNRGIDRAMQRSAVRTLNDAGADAARILAARTFDDRTKLPEVTWRQLPLPRFPWRVRLRRGFANLLRAFADRID